jgi:hypothetical protein
MKYIKCPCCNSIEEIPAKTESIIQPLDRMKKFELEAPAFDAVRIPDFTCFWCNICGVLFRVKDEEFLRP